jgi:hypothetical protein
MTASAAPASAASAARQYALVTSAYWSFTLTDGALRMLVLLHFYQLGYSPFTLAFLFLLYEAAGIVANLVGGLAGDSVWHFAHAGGGLVHADHWVFVVVGFVAELVSHAVGGVGGDCTRCLWCG